MNHRAAVLLWIIITTGLLVIYKPTVAFSSAWLTQPHHSSWYLSSFSPQTVTQSTSLDLDPALFIIPDTARSDIKANPAGILGQSIQQRHDAYEHKWLTSAHGEVGITAAATLLIDISAEDVKEIHRLSYHTEIGTISTTIENDYVLLKPGFSLLQSLKETSSYNLTYELGLALPPLRYRYADHQFSWFGQAGEIKAGLHFGHPLMLYAKNAYAEWGAQYHQPFAFQVGGIKWNAAFGHQFSPKWGWQIGTDIKWHMPNWYFQDFSKHELTEAQSNLNYYGIPLDFQSPRNFAPYDEISARISIIKSPKQKHRYRSQKESGLFVSYDPHSNHITTGVMTCLWFQF